MSVPEKPDRKYFVNPECSKKFVYAEAWKRSMICKSITTNVNGKKKLAKSILTYNTDSRVKEAHEKRND